MGLKNLFLVALLVGVLALTYGQFREEQLAILQGLDCDEPSVTLHVFSGTSDPVWKINKKQFNRIKTTANKILSQTDDFSLLSRPTTRVMGYQGFTIRCSSNQYVFVNGLSSLERLILLTGRNSLSKSVLQHVKDHVGDVMSDLTHIESINAGCNQVPIRGPDTVPKYDPQTDDDGCFVDRQTENNCYAYGKDSFSLSCISLGDFLGTDIVTNTFPQPGKCD